LFWGKANLIDLFVKKTPADLYVLETIYLLNVWSRLPAGSRPSWISMIWNQQKRFFRLNETIFLRSLCFLGILSQIQVNSCFFFFVAYFVEQRFTRKNGNEQAFQARAYFPTNYPNHFLLLLTLMCYCYIPELLHKVKDLIFGIIMTHGSIVSFIPSSFLSIQQVLVILYFAWN